MFGNETCYYYPNLFSDTSPHVKGVFKTLSNIKDGTFCENSLWLSTKRSIFEV